MRNDGMSHVVDDIELACLRASSCVLEVGVDSGGGWLTLILCRVRLLRHRSALCEVIWDLVVFIFFTGRFFLFLFMSQDLSFFTSIICCVSVCVPGRSDAHLTKKQMFD